MYVVPSCGVQFLTYDFGLGTSLYVMPSFDAEVLARDICLIGCHQMYVVLSFDAQFLAYDSALGWIVTGVGIRSWVRMVGVRRDSSFSFCATLADKSSFRYAVYYPS